MAEEEFVVGEGLVSVLVLIAGAEDVIFGVVEAEAPEGVEGDLEFEVAADGVDGVGGEAMGFGGTLLLPGDGEEVFTGVGVVDAGVAGGDGFAGGRAWTGGSAGVGAVGGEFPFGDVDEWHI